MSGRTVLYADPVTEVDLRRLADIGPSRPKIHMVRELRPDPERVRPTVATYGPLVAIALGLVMGLLLSFARGV
jgi:hypothetical protein